MNNFQLSLRSFVIGQQRVALFVPDAAAVKNAYEKGFVSFPYWSKVWPAAIALSEFIEEHSHYMQNKTVMELGAGLGLPSLLAARYAHHVVCTDHSEEAVKTLAKSAAHLNLRNFESAVVDWQRLPANLRTDVLLLSDINYEPESFATLKNIVNAFLDQDSVVLLSTPQRLMAKAFVAPFSGAIVQSKEYAVKEGTGKTNVSVLVLKKKRN